MLLIFRVNPLGELPQNSPGRLTLFEPGGQIMPITLIRVLPFGFKKVSTPL